MSPHLITASPSLWAIIFCVPSWNPDQFLFVVTSATSFLLLPHSWKWNQLESVHVTLYSSPGANSIKLVFLVPFAIFALSPPGIVESSSVSSWSSCPPCGVLGSCESSGWSVCTFWVYTNCNSVTFPVKTKSFVSVV